MGIGKESAHQLVNSFPQKKWFTRYFNLMVIKVVFANKK